MAGRICLELPDLKGTLAIGCTQLYIGNQGEGEMQEGSGLIITNPTVSPAIVFGYLLSTKSPFGGDGWIV